MKVVLGSQNRPKRQAVPEAFAKVFPGEKISLVTVDADSGVSAHPTDAEESLKGAINRAHRAKELGSDADYYVGVEGGLVELDGKYFEHGFVVIEDKAGNLSFGLSPGLEIRGKLLKSILGGEELSLALDSHFGLKDIGKTNGFYGLVTDDLITRVSGYIDAVIFALAPFNHPEYFD